MSCKDNRDQPAVNITSNYGDVKSITQEWVDQGWRQIEVLGASGSASSVFHIKSDNARFLVANWVEGGKPEKKVLSQDGHKYLLLRCEKPNGDSFVVVLSKSPPLGDTSKEGP